jgi:hypothetical protein
MRKIYVLGPLVALAVFGGAYWKFERGYAARQEEHDRKIRGAIEEKLRQIAADQAQARTEADAAQAVRRRERDAAARLADAQRQAREDAERRRMLAMERERKLALQLERLRLETENARHAVAVAEENRRGLQAEHQFLLRCVDEAEANRKAFFQLLEKLEQLEHERPKSATL